MGSKGATGSDNRRSGLGAGRDEEVLPKAGFGQWGAHACTCAPALPAAGLLFALASVAQAQAPALPTCEELTNLRLPGVAITMARHVADGLLDSIPELPPFCLVGGQIRPTSESDIRFEVWLPVDTWNGRFSGVGNAGWGGTIIRDRPNNGGLAGQLRRGYATAATDTGHPEGFDLEQAKFGFEHPERLIDFASRAEHEMTVAAKAIMQAFYGRPPRYSYWIGSSTGGYQGLMEAQRFPDDYDGILAGMPANNWTGLTAGLLDRDIAMGRVSSTYLDGAALWRLNRGVMAACDDIDGIVDGVLEDPRRCSFDPGELLCASPGGNDCLTQQQVQAARRAYRGLTDPGTGVQLFPGSSLGAELRWSLVPGSAQVSVPTSYFRWLVFADSLWDWRTFDFADPADFETWQRSEARLAPIMNATSPDLRAFRESGGRLIHWHGWSDPTIASQNSVDYYESVLTFFSRSGQTRDDTLRDVQDFYRLFMVPGLRHSTPGPQSVAFDMQSALEDWVEFGRAPASVLATYPETDDAAARTRKLCPFPRVAAYNGIGSPDEAASFACVTGLDLNGPA